MEKPRLLIVDREATRAGIRMALEGEVLVCGEADDAERAIRTAMRHQPDVCLVSGDIAGGAVAAVRGICRAAPNTAVVVLGQEDDVDGLLDAVRAGAVGFVPGAPNAESLRRVVRAVAASEAAVPRAMVSELLREVRYAGTGNGGLSSRESQVLRLLRRGRTTGEIARALKIAPVTVRRHISELVNKLGVADRSALVGEPRLATGDTSRNVQEN